MKRQGESLSAGTVVIVVDDDVAARNSLRFSLEVEGFVVRAYPGGTELLKDAELQRAGCLVIDQNLSGMNGLEVVARLRARDVAVAAIPITSYPTAVLRERAATAGSPSSKSRSWEPSWSTVSAIFFFPRRRRAGDVIAWTSWISWIARAARSADRSFPSCWF
jgi:two-component system response regulator FixJ